MASMSPPCSKVRLFAHGLNIHTHPHCLHKLHKDVETQLNANSGSLTLVHRSLLSSGENGKVQCTEQCTASVQLLPNHRVLVLVLLVLVLSNCYQFTLCSLNTP